MTPSLWKSKKKRRDKILRGMIRLGVTQETQ
jgi:hypothetical protein